MFRGQEWHPDMQMMQMGAALHTQGQKSRENILRILRNNSLYHWVSTGSLHSYPPTLAYQ